MGRPPLPVGTYGKITITTEGPKKVRARANYRDFDGRVREVARWGVSAAAAQRSLKTALTDRTGQAPGDMTGTSRVADLAGLWLESMESGDLAQGTLKQYKAAVKNYVLPGLGDLRLRELTVPATERALLRVRADRGAGAAKTARSVLSGMLGLAVRHGALESNPVRDVTRIPTRKKTVRSLTAEQVTDLLAKLRADDAANRVDLPDMVHFMLATGCRIGETCATRFSSVADGVVEINATVIRVKGEGLLVQERPKTDAGWRILALPQDALTMIEARRNRVRIGSGDGMVFCSPSGLLRDPSNTAADLKDALQRAGYAWVTSHTFRKTVATRLDDAGVSARQIADQLGHSKPSMTQDVYMGRKVVVSDAANVLSGLSGV